MNVKSLSLLRRNILMTVLRIRFDLNRKRSGEGYTESGLACWMEILSTLVYPKGKT